MDIYDFTKISIDPKTNLYDFTQLTHKSNPGVQLIQYTVQSGEEMRLDLICESIYNNMDNMDVLLSCNYIDNPLNIKEGSIIYYPDAGNVDLFRYSEPQATDVVNKLVNPTKTSRSDASRQKYVEENYSIPPVVLESPIEQVTTRGNSLVIGAGLF